MSYRPGLVAWSLQDYSFWCKPCKPFIDKHLDCICPKQRLSKVRDNALYLFKTTVSFLKKTVPIYNTTLCSMPQSTAIVNRPLIRYSFNRSILHSTAAVHTSTHNTIKPSVFSSPGYMYHYKYKHAYIIAAVHLSTHPPYNQTFCVLIFWIPLQI